MIQSSLGLLSGLLSMSSVLYSSELSLLISAPLIISVPLKLGSILNLIVILLTLDQGWISEVISLFATLPSWVHLSSSRINP